MRLIVEIGGREAIPLRAIPLTTDWESMHPEEIADALAEPDERRPAFRGLRAYYLDGGKAIAFKRRWWDSSVRWQLRELTAQLQEQDAAGPMAVTEAGRRWQHQSLALLPAGAFVWRDEFEPLYMAAHGAEGVTWADWSLEARDSALDEDPEAHDEAVGKAANERAALNFERHTETPELHALIAEAVAAITLMPTIVATTKLAPAAALSAEAVRHEDAPSSIAPAPAPAPAADPVAPAPEAISSEARSVIHRANVSRERALHPVINAARHECSDRSSVAEIWNVLKRYCLDEKAPFNGVTQDGHLQYTELGKVKYLRKGNLGRTLKLLDRSD